MSSCIGHGSSAPQFCDGVPFICEPHGLILAYLCGPSFTGLIAMQYVDAPACSESYLSCADILAFTGNAWLTLTVFATTVDSVVCSPLSIHSHYALNLVTTFVMY